MLVVSGNKFFKKDDKLYFAGWGNNEFYINQLNAMGPYKLLAWIKENNNIDASNLEEFVPNESISLLTYSNSISILRKMQIIKKEIKENADCINVRLPILESLIGFHYALRYNIPTVVDSCAHSFSSLWYHGGGIKYKLLSIPMELIMKYYHRKAKYIIYVSKHFLQEKYPSKATQIGIPDVVLNKPDISVLEKRLSKIKEPHEKFVLGLIGATQVEYRGHDKLILVASILRKKGINAIVRFLGGGTGDDKRIECAKKYSMEKYIEFSGKQPHDAVLEWIDDIDILVMPTKQETLGRAIIEAMSRGCPVIGSMETAINEQIGSDCIAKADDIDGIAAIAFKMITDTDYTTYCAYENFYRSFKYVSEYSNRDRKLFFDNFYKENNIQTIL